MTEAGPAPSTAPPPPPPPGRPPLRRRRDGRILGGVAAGVADHLAVDVAIVRILFVVVAVLTMPFGLLAYILGVVFIPAAAPGEEPPAGDASRMGGASRVGRDPAFWVGVTLLVVGALWILGGPLAPTRLVPGLLGRDLLWPLVLIAFGLALWRASDRSAPPPQAAGRPTTPPAAWQPPSPAPPAPVAPADPVQDHTTETTVSSNDTLDVDRPAGPDATRPIGAPTPPTSVYDSGWGEAPPPAPPAPPHPGGEDPAWSPPPRPPRSRSLLTRLTLGIALVAVGVLWLLDAANVITVGPGRLAAAALLVIGVGLLIGSVAGRGRWLILAGGLLLPLVIGAELLRPYGFHDFPRFDARGPHGQVAAAPLTVDELEDRYQLGAGTITLDLTDLELLESATTRVQVGAGEVHLRLPEDATVDVTGRVGVGQLTLGETTTGGFGQERTQRFDLGEGSELLVIELQVGFGQIVVTPTATLDAPVEEESELLDDALPSDSSLVPSDAPLVPSSAVLVPATR